MSNQDTNIDQLFKESFDAFSPEVSEGLWSSISDKLPSSGTEASVVATSKTAAWPLVAGAFVCVIAGVALVLGYQTYSPDAIQKNQPQAPTNKTIIADSTIDEESLETSFPQINPFDSNDPILKISEPATETYTVELVDNEPISKENAKQQNQPSSVVNLFLTKNTRIIKKENNKADNRTQQIENNELKVEISPKKELKPIINSSVSGGHAPLVIVFEQSEQAQETVWDFGDGYSSEGNIVEHIYREPGEYTVSVSIKKNNQEAFAQKQIVVNPRCIIQNIPNIFTPNGDGENDYFYTKGENIQSFFIQIFDLKGKVVFETDTIDTKWDGNNANGEPLGQGQYLYFIKATGIDKSDLSRTGSILLKR